MLLVEELVGEQKMFLKKRNLFTKIGKLYKVESKLDPLYFDLRKDAELQKILFKKSKNNKTSKITKITTHPDGWTEEEEL